MRSSSSRRQSRPRPGTLRQPRPSAAAASKDEQPSDSTAQRPAMKVPEVLAELEEACKHLGIKLTYEAIGGELGSGGLCKVKGQWRAIFDKRTTPAERVSLLAPILARFPIDEVPLSEPVRELLLRMRPRSKIEAESVQEAAP